MNYSGIYGCDSANGIGMRVSFYVSGCTHHCKGCFNPETWDFNHGFAFTPEVKESLLKALNKPYIRGITLLGGEPFELSNQEALHGLIKEIKEKLPDKDIWIYSGYSFEELTDENNERCHGRYTREILESTDVIVDGEFVEDLKDLKLRFKGSSNQRVIDVKKSLRNHGVVLSEYN